MSRILCLLASLVLAQAPDTVTVRIPHGETVRLAAGQRLVVEAKGNASTGFAWSATKVPDFLSQVGEPSYVQDPSDTPMPGRGGRYLLTFVATKAGEGVIELAYARPWEKEKPPIQTATLKVVAE
jgi:inhibitor of cysteine peptidase